MLLTLSARQGKMLQLRLPMEVQSGQSRAQRSAASKRLVITMPVLHAQRQHMDVTCVRQAPGPCMRSALLSARLQRL